MKRIKVHDRFFRAYLSHSEIVNAIGKLAAKLNEDYGNCEEPPVLLCTMSGAMAFTAELMKHLDFNHYLACTKISSYVGLVSSREIRTVFDPTIDVKDKSVIICEDLIETGGTVGFLRDHIKSLGARDVRVCTMLLKPGVYKGIRPEYCAMEIDSGFIVGFGLDYNELGRHYEDIYILDEQ